MLAVDDALAAATLDRLLHHGHVVQSDGRSFRLREIEKQIGDGWGRRRASLSGSGAPPLCPSGWGSSGRQ